MLSCYSLRTRLLHRLRTTSSILLAQKPLGSTLAHRLASPPFLLRPPPSPFPPPPFPPLLPRRALCQSINHPKTRRHRVVVLALPRSRSLATARPRHRNHPSPPSPHHRPSLRRRISSAFCPLPWLPLVLRAFAAASLHCRYVVDRRPMRSKPPTPPLWVLCPPHHRAPEHSPSTIKRLCRRRTRARRQRTSTRRCIFPFAPLLLPCARGRGARVAPSCVVLLCR